VADTARARREAIRQLDDLRRRLAAAEDALAEARATTKRAEIEFDAASDRFTEAENALDAARAERAPGASSTVRGPAGSRAGGYHGARLRRA
jgi:predicted  nucleic acid-binding Zn-ribbon protein